MNPVMNMLLKSCCSNAEFQQLKDSALNAQGWLGFTPCLAWSVLHGSNNIMQLETAR